MSDPIQAAENAISHPDPTLSLALRGATALLTHARTLEAELARKTAVVEAQWEIVESFKKENAELRAALKPFAEYHGSDEYLKSAPDDGLCAAASFTAGDYRKARALAAQDGGASDEHGVMK